MIKIKCEKPMDVAEIKEWDYDSRYDWYQSAPIRVPVLGGQQCKFYLEGFKDDTQQSDFSDAIKAFLALKIEALEVFAPHVYAYAKDYKSWIDLKDVNEIWKRVTYGDEVFISRRPWEDQSIYVLIFPIWSSNKPLRAFFTAH